MRIFSLLVLWICSTAAMADFITGMSAYEQSDYEAALPVLADAAAGGDADGQFILGRMYANGSGVLQDFVEAYKWYNIAAAQGQRLAAVARDSLAMRMNESQVADAQARALAWQGGDATTIATATSDTPSDTTTTPPSFDVNETIVTQVQLSLKRLGYPIGEINGQLDDQTRIAVENYQTDFQLAVSGINAELLRHLDNNRSVQPAIRRTQPTILPGSTTPASSNFRKLL